MMKICTFCNTLSIVMGLTTLSVLSALVVKLTAMINKGFHNSHFQQI